MSYRIKIRKETPQKPRRQNPSIYSGRGQCYQGVMWRQLLIELRVPKQQKLQNFYGILSRAREPYIECGYIAHLFIRAMRSVRGVLLENKLGYCCHFFFIKRKQSLMSELAICVCFTFLKNSKRIRNLLRTII